MQSGKKNTKKWLVKPVFENSHRFVDSLMKWTSSSDTKSQLKFEFNSKEEAIEFTKKQGFEFEVCEPKIAKITPKSYAANFTS